MKSETYCIANAVVIAITLNIGLPILLAPFATDEEREPPNGAAALSMKSQFMHMMVHHNRVPLISSVIVALIVGVAVFLGYKMKPIEQLMKLMK